MENNVITQKFNFNSRHLYATSYQLPENADPQKVQQLSDYIATLRTEENLNVEGLDKYEKIYRAMQELKDDVWIDFGECEDGEVFVAQARQLYPKWHIRLYDPTGYFLQFTFALPNKDPKDGPPSVYTNTLIKVFLSTVDHHHREIYLGLLHHCAEHFKRGFMAKFALRPRSDTICIWLTREDFFALEPYVTEHEDEFVTPLHFVPYRGKMGISRDVYLPGSYNMVISDMLFKYLKALPPEAPVSINDLYDGYVRELFTIKKGETRPETHSFMQTVITVLDSADLLVGVGSLTDDHEFLQSETVGWQILDKASDWDRVKERAQYEYQKDSADEHEWCWIRPK
ncbi:MAG: hypothetical protein IJ228_01980 [Succinivibrio sp.]|nr:hypothetical protein [Succinivibrio sp.]